MFQLPNEKIIQYSYGGIPLLTYLLIGFTTTMLVAIQFLDGKSEDKTENEEIRERDEMTKLSEETLGGKKKTRRRSKPKRARKTA